MFAFNVLKATEPSYDSQEAIECTTIVAFIIFYARMGLKKEEILKKLNINLCFRPFDKFNTTCYETLQNCLYAVLISNHFEEALREVISYGGDMDTNACIVGSMAEALYGIDGYLIDEVKKKLPNAFVQKIELAYANVNYYPGYDKRRSKSKQKEAKK